jgi:hypothetical protein
LRAPTARVFARDSSESAYFKLLIEAHAHVGCEPMMIRIRGMMSEDRYSVFAFVPTDSPAAIRRLGATGKAPV